MPHPDHRNVTGFSGNEIYCLHKLGYRPGQLCLGNTVLSLGVVRGIGAGLSNLAGGEITEVTKIIHDGRRDAYNRLLAEARENGGTGLAGISFDLINHGSNLEFLAFGSTLFKEGSEDSGAIIEDLSNQKGEDEIKPPPTNSQKQNLSFSSFADGQELFCQIDAGFKPSGFVFGNIAYSIGVGGNIGGMLRGLARGEVPQFTEIFNHTRHMALIRIKEKAKKLKANAVLGIQTSIMPLMGTQEMLMLGTAATHPALTAYNDDPVTSDMTNEEMWNMVNMGYMPVSLVMGVSVYSLGIVSGVMSLGRTIAGGEVSTLTELLYEAREKAFDRIHEDAKNHDADEVIGVKTRVYDLGGGLIEVMAIGTAVKKMPGIGTKHDTLPAQAIIQDRDTFVESFQPGAAVARMKTVGSARQSQRGPIQFVFTIVIIIFYIMISMFGHHR